MVLRVLEWYDESQLPDGITETDGGGLEDDYGKITYLTDGACQNNGLRTSYGACAFFGGTNCFNSWVDPADRSTNQTAELGAIFGAVCRAVREEECSIKILTDSKYCINAISVWPKQCWWDNARDGVWYKGNGDQVKNQWLIRRILGKMKEHSIVAEFEHIPREENEIADKMAKEAL